MKLVTDEQLINHVEVMKNNLYEKESRRITLDISENELTLLSELLDISTEDERANKMWNIFEDLHLKNI